MICAHRHFGSSNGLYSNVRYKRILFCRDVFGEDKRERLTTNDALSYLREVKTRFANNRKVYDR